MRAPLLMRRVPARRHEPAGARDGARVPGAIGQIATRKPRSRPPRSTRHRPARSASTPASDAASARSPSRCAVRRPYPRKRALRRSWRRISSRCGDRPARAVRPSGCEPLISSQLRHCFQTRYCASPSASIARVGATWMTLARHSSSRSLSSGAETLKSNAPLAFARSLAASRRSGGEIGDDEPRALARRAHRRGGGVIAFVERLRRWPRSLIGEFAGRIVVGDAQQRARERVVGGGNVEDGESFARMRLRAARRP